MSEDCPGRGAAASALSTPPIDGHNWEMGLVKAFFFEDHSQRVGGIANEPDAMLPAALRFRMEDPQASLSPQSIRATSAQFTPPCCAANSSNLLASL